MSTSQQRSQASGSRPFPSSSSSSTSTSAAPPTILSHNKRAKPPPTLSRLSFPKLWKRQHVTKSQPAFLNPNEAADGKASASTTATSDTSPANSPSLHHTLRQRTRSGLSAFLSPRPDPAEELAPGLTAYYPDPDAIKAFAEALEEDEGQKDSVVPAAAASAWAKLGLPRIRSPSSAPEPSPQVQQNTFSSLGTADMESEPTLTIPTSQSQKRVGKIAAASDFAPVRERTTKGTTGGPKDTGRREGLVYNMLRWPLLLSIFITIGLEFFAYVLTRQIVNVVEWLIAHRGRKGNLRRQMRKAETFDQWRDTALELDDFMSHESWKREDASGLYDWILIKKVFHSLKTFREQDDAQELMAVLDLCCRNNFAGTENFRLYSETYYGTKYLIEAYLAEIEQGMDYIVKTDQISVEQKKTFFRSVSKNLGKSGLCLSGGGAFGYYHIGLCKALLDSGLLPKIVSGTSAGGLIAALVCTRTDEELSSLLVPEMADRITACEEPLRIWAKRVWKTGARFDPIAWADKASFFTLGSLTFKEAYERTGKTLNISVIPSERNSPVKLLNYLTAPRCVIWSALLASAAVPGLLPPVCLMQKTKRGEYVPWNWGHRFKDGSLRVDIPLQDLHSMFAVNYPIVSQVNPHVHLFFFAPKGMPGRPVAHRRGKGWRGGFILSASEHVLKLHLSLNFKIIRDLDLLPAILGTDWSGVFLQRFGGAVTIWPKTRFLDWVHILSDPDRVELSRMIRVGRQATWPKLHMIENRIRLERAVDQGRKACRSILRAQAKANNAGAVSSSGGPVGPGSQAHQDSGTDVSAAPTPGMPIFSDTDGEGVASDHRVADDYFKLKPARRLPKGGDRSHQISALRRRLGMMTPGEGDGGGVVDGAQTPASQVHTPGELPRPMRERSMGMDDDTYLDGEEIPSDGDSQGEAPATATATTTGGPSSSSSSSTTTAFSKKGLSSNGGESVEKALTAAALSPSVIRSNRRRSTSSSGSHNSKRHLRHHHHRYSPSATTPSVREGVDGLPDEQQQQSTLRAQHDRAWSQRGSIGPESPWGDEEADQSEGESSSSSSEEER